MPVWLVRLLPYVLAVVLAGGSLWWARQTGVAYEKAKAEIAALQADKTALQALNARWEAAARASEAQRAQEQADAAAALAAMTDRLAALKADRDIQDAAAAGLEQDLAVLETDKDKLNALILKLKTAIGSGRRATAADVEFDRRMLGAAKAK